MYIVYVSLPLQVKNQGTHCKQSSWAFSAAAAIEGQYYRETGQLVTLSEQQLIDCSAKFGNAGCHGGHMVNSFKYVIKSGGLCKEIEYSYLGYVSHFVDCSYSVYGWALTILHFNG